MNSSKRILAHNNTRLHNGDAAAYNNKTAERTDCTKYRGARTSSHQLNPLPTACQNLPC